MKRFIQVFIILEIALFTYIFNTSIYNVYEKNHVITSDLNGYCLETVTPEILSSFYSVFISSYSNNKMVMVKNSLTSTEKTVYELYCFPINDYPQKKPVSRSIEIEYYELSREAFLDSTGIFYTDLSLDDLNEMASSVGSKVVAVDNDPIAYTQIVRLNALNGIVLFIVIQIVYGVYTSFSLKKMGIKKILGYSPVRIISEQVSCVIGCFLSTFIFMMLLMWIILSYSDRMNTSYFAACTGFFLLVLIINIICVLTTIIIGRNLKIESIIKNQSLSQMTNNTMQVAKAIFTIIIAVTIIVLLNEVSIYRKSKQDVLNYRYLDGYYTANGFYSTEYEYAEDNLVVLEDYSDKMTQMYLDNEALLCDVSSLQSDFFEIESNRPEYQRKTLIANNSYLKEFSEIMINGKKWSGDKIDESVVLIPERYKDIEDELKTYLEQEYFRLLNYDRFWGLNVKERSIDVTIQYIDDESSMKVITQEGFSDIKDVIVILDVGSFAGLYYLDAMNQRQVFYSLDDRDEFQRLLKKNGMEKLIVAGTLLTPFMIQLENTFFVLKTLVMFSIVFVMTLLFILYTSNYTDVLVHKKRYAIKEIMGFSHKKILQTRYLIWLIEVVIIIPLIMAKTDYALLCGVIIFDFIFCEFHYTALVKRKLYEIGKGA